MDIWQRGTSYTGLAGSDYVADRWVAWATTGSQSNYVSRQAIGNLSVTPVQAVRYSLRFGRTNGTTNTGARYLFQTLENADSVRFTGKAVTFSFYARRGADYSQLNNSLDFFVTSGTGTDQIYYSFTNPAAVVSTTTVALTTSWQRFQATGTVNTNVTQLGFGFVFVPTGTAGADDWFEVTGIQLEEGSIATSYKSMTGTIQGELAACQRYYQVIGETTTGQPIVQAYTSANAFHQTPQNLAVRMRSTPTATLLGTWTVGDCGQPVVANVTAFGYSLQTQKNGTTGMFYFYPDSTDDKITFSAEL
jgi:hypothetical protein